jgi:transmembrane sensor
LKVAAAIVLIACSALLLVQQFSIPEMLPVAEAFSAVQTIELEDGSTVTLRPNSTLSKFTDSENTRSYSLSGEAVFDVMTDPDQVFTVEAGAGRVVVTGTRFNLNVRNEISRVYLFEGSVRFEAANGSNSVNLEPGDATEIDSSMQILEPYQFETEIVTGWMQNRLTFRDRQAGSVMDEIEFHFDIQIIASEDIRDESLGGTIQLDKAEQSLSDLGIVLGGSFEETSEDVYEFKSSGNLSE